MRDETHHVPPAAQPKALTEDPAPGAVLVACLCAAWCRTCDGYAAVFQEALVAHPQLRARWVDIEDEADLLGDFDVETFPTLVIADAQAVYFAGPLTPQLATLQRVLRAALASAAQQAVAAPAATSAAVSAAATPAAAPAGATPPTAAAAAPGLLALVQRLRA